MDKQRRSALIFFCLACLVILTCMTQRIAGLNALSSILHQETTTAQALSTISEIDKIPAPCELSSKSLLSVPPLLLEFAFLALSLLLAFLSRCNMAAIR